MDPYDIRRMPGGKARVIEPGYPNFLDIEVTEDDVAAIERRIAELEAEMALWPSEIGRSADGGDGR